MMLSKRTASVAALAIGCAALNLTGQEKPVRTATAQSKPVVAKKDTAPSASGWIAVKDPVTGQLRAPEAADYRELKGISSFAASETPEVVTFAGPMGTIGAVVPQEAMSFAVATKGIDGKIEMNCVDGKKNAEKAISLKPAARNTEAANAR